jgi:hypothetical protein
MNLRPFLSKLKIVNKDRETIPLALNWAQDDFVRRVEAQHNAGRPMRAIVLKARQLGLSTVSEGVIFTLSFLYDNNRSLVVSHDEASYKHLLNISKHYWSTYWAKRAYTTTYLSRRELAWNETGSSIFTATAKSVDAARSQTVHALHASEVAFWPDPGTLMTGLRQAIPNKRGTFICLESTANGVGNYFHSEWEAAVNGDTEFIPVFYPWWKHPEYTASVIGLTSILGALSSDERLLKVYLMAQGLTSEQADDRLAWYRWAHRNLAQGDVKKLHQEYPTTPEDAFQSTGRNVFPLAELNKVYRRNEGTRGYIHITGGAATFTENIDGTAAIYRWPSRNRDYGRYIVAGDPTHTTRGDFAVVQVLHRRTLEQVARIRLRCTPIEFAKHLVAVAKYYNDALLVSESTGPGYATIGAVMTMGYPYVWQGHWLDKTPGSMSDRYGFETNVARKSAAVGWALQCVSDQSLVIHDPITYNEMKNYVALDGGGYGPVAAGMFDDCVMALAIGLVCHFTEPPLPPVGADSTKNPFDAVFHPEMQETSDYNEMVGT